MSTSQKINVVQSAYDFALSLYAAGALEEAIPVEKHMLGADLATLVGKHILERKGQTPGRFGQSGKVRFLVPQEVLNPIANRPPRRITTGTPRPRRSASDAATAQLALASPKLGLSIAALEQYVQRYRTIEESLREQHMGSIESRIADLQGHLASTTEINDVRNTITMLNSELKQLDEVERDIAIEVLGQMDPGGIASPLEIVWKAMSGK